VSGCKRRIRGEGGFTLVEVLVALGLITVLMLSVLPALVFGLSATRVTRLNTQAKNLAQERVDLIRNLRFHVDSQNGPFRDMLDMYYTNATGSSPVTSIATGAATLNGRFVQTGTGAAGEPANMYYRTTTGPLPGAPMFSQVITAQFLDSSGAVVPAATFVNKYDSQTTGRDKAPSLLVGVNVITSWVQDGEPKQYVVRTRITDGRPQLPVIQTQSRAVAVQISSTAVDGTTLDLQGGIATLEGAQSSGSSLAGRISGALASRSGVSVGAGLTQVMNLPGSSTATSGNASADGGAGCSWWGYGATGTSSLDGSIDVGLPKAPANVDSSTPLVSVSAGINHQGGGATCGQLSFDNLVDGGVPRTDPVGSAMGAAPYVKAPDTTSWGRSIFGTGYVTSNALTSSPRQSRSGATTGMGTPVILFPSHAPTAGAGLVQARLLTAGVDCVSGAISPADAIEGRYQLELRWWGSTASQTTPVWHAATWTYDSASGAPTHTGEVWDPTGTTVSPGLTLDQLVDIDLTGGLPASVQTGSTTGQRGFPDGVVTLTTASTLANEPALGYSAIKVQLGQLTCVADDLR